MPTGAFDSKPSWADQVEEEQCPLKALPSERLKGIPLPTGDTSPEPELLPGDPLQRLVPGGCIDHHIAMVRRIGREHI